MVSDLASEQHFFSLPVLLGQSVYTCFEGKPCCCSSCELSHIMLLTRAPTPHTEALLWPLHSALPCTAIQPWPHCESQ